MTARRALGAAAAAICAILVTPAGAQAAPARVHCGDVLRADTRLDRNLRCSATDGLTLGPGVTLDLGGHTVQGPAHAVGGGVGITMPADGNATVQNGRISGWGIGTAAASGQQSTGSSQIHAVTFTANSIAVNYSDPRSQLTGPHRLFAITGSTFDGNGDAVWGLFGRAVVSGSVFTHNRVSSGYSDGGSLSITQSVIQGNQAGFDCFDSRCSITHSSLLDNQSFAVNDYENPIDTAAAVFTITDNQVSRNGIGVDAGRVFTLLDVERNTFADNTTAVALTQSNAHLVQNDFRGNRTGVARAADPDFAAVLEGNHLNSNRDGIRLDAPATGAGLRANVAVDNRRWGIYAPGATDLGGNLAVGNGRTPQCVGVLCSPPPPGSRAG